MTDQSHPAQRRPRAPMPRRARRRWAVAAGLAGCWALLLAVTGSVVAGTALLMILAALGAGCAAGLRCMGVTTDHPWLRRLAARPWRDGQDVLRLGLRRLPDVFVITPAGSLVAPDSVQLWLSPGDFGSLCELMDIGLINSTATEVYEGEITARGARLAGPGPAGVSVLSDPAVPPGRYRLRQGRSGGGGDAPAGGGGYAPAGGDGYAPAGGDGYAPAGGDGYAPAGGDGYAPAGGDGQAPAGAAPGGTLTGLPTLAEPAVPPVPPLRLVTGGCVVQTRRSGARAGRGAVDLVLPQVPTVSREHARFTFADGRWWVTNLGRNGLTLNGVPLVAGQPLRDGDAIRWGSEPDALLSRVEIG